MISVVIALWCWWTVSRDPFPGPPPPPPPMLVLREVAMIWKAKLCTAVFALALFGPLAFAEGRKSSRVIVEDPGDGGTPADCPQVQRIEVRHFQAYVPPVTVLRLDQGRRYAPPVLRLDVGGHASRGSLRLDVGRSTPFRLRHP